MSNNPFNIQIDIGYDETQASQALETVLKKLKDGYKLKLSLDIGDLDKVNQQLNGLTNQLDKTFKLDTSQAMNSIQNIDQTMNRIDKRQFKFVDNEQIQYIENVKKNLIETQKVVEDLKSGRTKITISEDYIKAYSELEKLQKQEFGIKNKMIGKDQEHTKELQKQLDTVRLYQNEIAKTINKYNVPNKQEFNKSLLRERNIEQSALNIKKDEYVKKLKEETSEIQRQVTNYQKRKIAQVETFKSRYEGLYDKGSVNRLEESIKNIKVDNLKDLRKEFQNIDADFKKVEASAKTSSKAIKSTQKDAISATEMIENSIKKFSLWLVAGNISMKAINFFRSGINYVIDFNKALTEISVVTNQNQSQVEKLANSYGKLAKDLSVLKEEAVASAVEFYRQGLSQNETMERVAVTTKYAKISNMDFRTSAELLTATVNSMGRDIEDVTDVFIKLGDSTATSSEELGKGFQKVGGQANTMNVGLEKASSWLATISARTRESAESIGTGLKTIMARYQQLTEKGFVEEDGTKINNVAKALDKAGIKMINESTGQFRNFGNVMDELGEKWNTLDKRTQAYISNAMAGTYQISRFTNLMEGYGDSIDLYEQALDSAGTTRQKYNLWLQGTEAYINRIKEQGSDIWRKFFDSDTLKSGLSTIEKLLKLINSLIDKLGVIPTSIMTIGSVGMLISKNFRKFANEKLFDAINDNIFGINKSIREAGDDAEKAVTKFTKMSDAFILFGKPLSEMSKFSFKGFFNTSKTGLTQIPNKLKLIKTNFQQTRIQSGLFGASVSSLNVLLSAFGVKLDVTKAKLIALKTVATATHIAVTIGLSFFVTKGLEFLDNVINKNEKLKDNLSELEQNVKNNIESNTRNIQSLSSLADEYNELTGKTKLSSKEHGRLCEIQNQIAEISPEVVTGYDDQNNAIINLTGGIEGVIEALKEKNRIEQLSLIGSWSKKQEILEDDIKKEEEGIKKEKRNHEMILGNIERFNKSKQKAMAGGNVKKTDKINESLKIQENNLAEVNARLEEHKSKIKDINNQALPTASAMLNRVEEFHKLDDSIKKMISSLMKAKGINISPSDAENLIKIFSDKRLEGIIKQLKNLKMNPSSVKDFNKELEKTIESFTKLINELSGGKIKLDTKDILSAFNLKELENGINDAKEQIKQFKDARNDLKEYAGYIKELNENGYLSADSMAGIIEKHEELIPYLLDEGNLYEKLIELQNKEKDNAVKALLIKIDNNEMFLNNIKDKNKELFKELSILYNKDLNDFLTIGEVKQEINNLLIKTMGN